MADLYLYLERELRDLVPGEGGAGGDGEGFDAHYARGFASVYRPRRRGETSFAELLGRVAPVDPEMRVATRRPTRKSSLTTSSRSWRGTRTCACS